MEAHPALLAASGNCNAYSGIGDPYLPFREVLGMLTGDVEARWEAGAITTEHARRLWGALPLVVQTLLDHGPHVTGTLVRGQALLARARAVATPGAPWLERLQERVARQTWTSEGLEQSHLFQQVTHVLRALAEQHPLLLVLDDLQWTDTASASLLFHLGRRLTSSRILVVGTYRPEEVALGRAGERHPLEAVLAEFKRTLGDIWLDLSEVHEPEGRHFVDALLATEPNRLGEGFRRSLFEHTGGHPLFTVELLRTMQERGDLVQDESDCWVEGAALDWETLPTRVEGVIEARIGRLEEDLREILSVASVEGEDFTSQVVARVQELGERQALRRLSRELERQHRLVREQSALRVGRQRLSRYRFAHALFQQYLYNHLGDGERALLHGEVATVLEELYQGHPEGVAAIAPQLARHFAEAGDLGHALRYLILAGDAALAAYANGEAEAYYRQGLEWTPEESERAHLLSGLGEARFGQGLFTEAMETWREGIELYQALSNSDGVAQLYARLVRAAREGNDPQESQRLGLEGLAAVEGAADSHDLALLLHQVALDCSWRTLREEGRLYAEQALAMAERLGDVEVQVHVLATLGAFHLDGVDAKEALEKAVAFAEANELLQAGSRAHNNLGIICRGFLSDHGAGRQHFLRATELLRRTGDTPGQLVSMTNLVDVSIACGDFAVAETTLLEARSLIDELAEPGWATALVLLAEADYLSVRGEWLAAARIARAQMVMARERGSGYHLAHAARLLAGAVQESLRMGSDEAAGEWQEAEESLAEAIEIFDRMEFAEHCVATRLSLGALRVRQGRLSDGQRLLAQAREMVRKHCPDWSEVRLLPLQALIARAEGRWTEALAALEAAAATQAHLGERWAWARRLLDRAEVHVARGEAGDRQRARELLGDALAAFEEMGAPGYASVAKDRLEALEAAS
jgi:tetratricopeptide (TPR) repeat protein